MLSFGCTYDSPEKVILTFVAPVNRDYVRESFSTIGSFKTLQYKSFLCYCIGFSLGSLIVCKMIELTSEDYFFCKYFNRISNITDVKVIACTTRSRGFFFLVQDKTRPDRTGDTGDTGDAGDTGATGNTGSTLKGTRGYRGHRLHRGHRGHRFHIKRDTGAQGPQGTLALEMGECSDR